MEYRYVISKVLISSVVVLNSSPSKEKKNQLYHRADWCQMKPILYAFHCPWYNLNCISPHYRSSYFCNYNNFPARFFMLVWFCPFELIKWPRCPTAHHSCVHISEFSSCHKPFMLFAAVVYKSLALWYILQDAGTPQLHSSSAFNIQSALQVLQFNTCACQILKINHYTFKFLHCSKNVWSVLSQQTQLCLYETGSKKH